MVKRLANIKTRSETGFDYVVNNLEVHTPFGRKILKEIKPFFPGQEEELRQLLQKVDAMKTFYEREERLADVLSLAFMAIKDISFTIGRSKNNVLSVVEIFEIKSLLLQMKAIREALRKSETPVPEEFIPEDTEELLDVLDPRRDRMNTFYIYDEFSQVLRELRSKKRELEINLRREQKGKKEEIQKKYGISLTPKFDITVSKSAKAQLELLKEIGDMEQQEEDYVSVTFTLKKSERAFAIVKDMEALNSEIEEEEERIRELLSKKIAEYEGVLIENCNRIGELDFQLAKGIYAVKRRLTMPEIVSRHIVEIEDGRHIQAEDILEARGKKYCPVSISLEEGVTCITGANMGGKTVSLKLAGLVAILAQYGFFVPCKRATVGLSEYMQILIGDSQSMERGLSSFGSEMEELREILDNSRDRALLMIDEIASGTNPVEATALTKAIVSYLNSKKYITLLTTHFDSVTEEEGVVNMQVMGLAGVDFNVLDREIRYANRKERIEIIGKYMDYRLYKAQKGEEIPKDALNIAKMLGIPNDIIERAKGYIKNK